MCVCCVCFCGPFNMKCQLTYASTKLYYATTKQTNNCRNCTTVIDKSGKDVKYAQRSRYSEPMIFPCDDQALTEAHRFRWQRVCCDAGRVCACVRACVRSRVRRLCYWRTCINIGRTMRFRDGAIKRQCAYVCLRSLCAMSLVQLCVTVALCTCALTVVCIFSARIRTCKL